MNFLTEIASGGVYGRQEELKNLKEVEKFRGTNITKSKLAFATHLLTENHNFTFPDNTKVA